jgi:quercetin dioxygenase-like cupin family protein
MWSLSEPLVLDAGGGELLTFPGVSTRIKVRGEMTNGAWTLIESTVAPQFAGFKRHVHSRITETFYLLEGVLTLELDGTEFECKPGALVVIPPGVRHAYWNATDAPAKYLLHIAPGGFDKFLQALAELAQTGRAWTDADKARINALALEYDATI